MSQRWDNQKKSELMSYEKKEQATAKYHSNMSADMIDETLSRSMCTVLDALVGCILNDYWGHMTVIEEENSEPEEQN